MTGVVGDRVLLRGFRRDEIDEAFRRMAGQIAAADANGERARTRRLRIERSGSRNDWEILFAIESDGRLVGDVQARCPEYAMPPGVWEIGVELWREADRGRGLGREAVALLSTHLFESEDAIRVQATTDVDNRAMRPVLEGLGFGLEGVLRGFMPSVEGPRDTALYGLTKDDWENVKDRWTRTS